MRRFWTALKAAYAAFRTSWRTHATDGRFRLQVNGRDVLRTDSGGEARRAFDASKGSENIAHLYDGDAIRGTWVGRLRQ